MRAEQQQECWRTLRAQQQQYWGAEVLHGAEGATLERSSNSSSTGVLSAGVLQEKEAELQSAGALSAEVLQEQEVGGAAAAGVLGRSSSSHRLGTRGG